MRRLLAVVVGVWALALAGLAHAGETIAYGPAPGWVKPFEIPAGKPDAPGPAQVLLLDSQTFFSRRGTEQYTVSAMKVLTPQGLQALGTLNTSWDPAREDITVHRAEIRRGDQTIDLLAGPDKFATLRRETNLSRAVLDGTLTAILEVRGLRVGDVLVLEYTTVFRDPIIGDHAEAFRFLAMTAPVAKLRMRQVWTKDRPVRWKATEFFGEVKSTENGDLMEIESQWTDLESPRGPAHAPPRYAVPARLEVSDFSDWRQVSRLMAPLYAEASTLAANSPLKAEVERIKAAHATPEARALAAFQLVETDVRYLAILMGAGGYLPAKADETWTRRFGDCKAKTALLIALLRELGIQAEPAMVHSGGGDGLDERLPGFAAFDHVIVRAVVHGKTYWLDGTRNGDRALASPSGVPFVWALPIRSAGAELERVVNSPPERPLLEVVLALDAREGLERKGPAKVQVFLRGDAANELQIALQSLEPEQARQGLESLFDDRVDWLDVERSEFGWDEASQAFKVEFSGRGQLEWERRAGLLSTGADEAFTLDFKPRPKGPYADAPFHVGSPQYTSAIMRVRMPRDAADVRLDGGDIDVTAAGFQIRRTARIEKGEVIVESSVRSLATEVPVAEALLAARDLNERTERRLVIVSGPGAADPAAKQAAEFNYLARVNLAAKKSDEALAYADRALKLDGRNIEALTLRKEILVGEERFDEALADVRTLGRIDPSPSRDAEEALLLLGLKRFRPALDKAEAALKGEPGLMHALIAKTLAQAGLDQAANSVRSLEAIHAVDEDDESLVDALSTLVDLVAEKSPRSREAYLRGLSAMPENRIARLVAGAVLVETEPARAVAEYDQALRIDPDFTIARWRRLFANAKAQQFKAALSDADHFVKAQPRSARALAARATVYEEMKQFDQASADYEAALKLSPNDAGLLNEVCWYRATNNIELDKALSECSEAVRLEPDYAEAWDSRGLVNLRLGRMRESITDYDKSLEDRDSAMSLFGRGLAKRGDGDHAGGDADIAQALKLEPTIAKTYEDYGLKP